MNEDIYDKVLEAVSVGDYDGDIYYVGTNIEDAIKYLEFVVNDIKANQEKSKYIQMCYTFFCKDCSRPKHGVHKRSCKLYVEK